MTLNTDESDRGTSSNLKIFANIIISFIGAGILGLPFAFKEVSTVIRLQFSAANREVHRQVGNKDAKGWLL